LHLGHWHRNPLDGGCSALPPKTRVEKSPVAIFYLERIANRCYRSRAMIAHTEPVRSWGFEPCGRLVLPTITCVSAGGGAAPRPSGNGRGNPEVITFLNSALDRTDGGRQFAGLVQRRAFNEQRPSPATAPSASPVSMAHPHEGDHRTRAIGIRHSSSSSNGRLGGDLGTAAA
jgi:hypothetical protein